VSGNSVSFDRAAEYYDSTRETDAESLRTIVDLLAASIQGRTPVLELGVGTGQLALPLAERGVPVVGIDLSAEMMSVLRGKLGAGSLPLVQGDATRLPFARDSFGAAYARWVLHLIPDWTAVLHELDRVLASASVIAIDPGGFSGVFAEMHERFVRILGTVAEPVGLGSARRGARLDQGMRSIGWELVDTIGITYAHEVSIAETLDGVPGKEWSWTWRIPDDELTAAVDQVRRWAEARFGSLTEPIPAVANDWRIYERART
jgi:SAM-dependent methyltransferase